MKKRFVIYAIILFAFAACNVAERAKEKYITEKEIRTDDVLSEIKGEPKKESVKDTATTTISKRKLKRLEKERIRQEKIMAGDTLNFFERTFPKRIRRDSIYPQIYKETPRSILVVYPWNRSKNQYGDKMFLTSITQELSLKGYYLFSVFMLTQQAQQDTLFNSHYQNAANVKSYFSNYGADAALFITIYTINKEYWSTKTEIVADYTMISTHGGDTIFQRRANFAYSSPFPLKDKSEESLLEDNKEFQIYEAIKNLQHYVFSDFPLGPYHNEYLKDKKKFSHTPEMDYKISIIPEQ